MKTEPGPPPPGGHGQFGYANNVAFVEPQPVQKSAGKTIAIAIGTVITCLFLLAVVAVFALSVLGSTVSTEFSEIELETGAAAPEAIALADDVYIDATGSYEMQLGATWEAMAEVETPTGTQGWNVVEDGRAVAAVFTTAGPSVAQGHDQILAGTIAGLSEALPASAEIDGAIETHNGKEFAVINTAFRDENNIEVSTYQVIRVGDGTIAVATLSGPSEGFDQLRSRLERALHTLDVIG